VTSRALGEQDARNALRKAVPRFASHEEAGQIEIVPPSGWQGRGGKSGRVILSKLDKAILGGFDGLRIACNAIAGKEGRKGFLLPGADAVRSNHVIAAFAYPKASFDALGLMEVVKNHRFALVRNAGAWEVIESSEARTVKDELERSEEKLRSLFNNMSEGFAYLRAVLDERGNPSDCIFLQVNEAFERLTGRKAKSIIGKPATVAFPGIENDAAGWIGKCGNVALTGKPIQFENYSEHFRRWYEVSAFSPHRGYFAVTFSDITERKRADETIRHQNVVLNGIGRILHLALTSETEEELGRACLAVAEEVTKSRFGFIGEVGPDGLLHDLAISDPGWKLCTMQDKTGHRRPPGDFTLHGLYGRVILDGKGFFTNEPSSHPDSIGTPEGHPRISAFLGVPLLQDGKIFGMVGMANREGGYRTEDLDALGTLAGAIVQAFRRNRAETALRTSLSEKEILLKELAHRTKNNMQVVGSLLSLQAVSSQDKTLHGVLAEIQDRIRAMALVHEKLYRSGNFASLNLGEYVKDLMASLLRARHGAGGPVRTNLDLEDIFISIDAALPCGLIINELVSNSLKHAFHGRESGAIFLSLRSAGKAIELTYRDDGPGLPRDLDLSRTRSLGLKLVYNLAVRQLRGAMEIRRDPASEFVITFGGLSHGERM
jgi:PAS domain S-box-containing protein